MIYLYLISLSALAVVVISYPFWAAADNDPEWQAGVDHKAQIMATLNEIEFDYQTNKLSEEDYHNLRRKFERASFQLYQREEQLGELQQEGEN